MKNVFSNVFEKSARFLEFLEFVHFCRKMSILREIKSEFNINAWCPLKEHASLMVIASAKNLTAAEVKTTKSISIYDWSLENVDQGRYQVEEPLPSGATALCWSLTVVPGKENAVGLICVGLEDGTVQFYIPYLNEENTWELENVFKLKCTVTSRLLL